MTAGLADTLDFTGATRLILGDERVAVINAQRQIEDGIVGKPFAPFGRKLAFEDVIAFEPNCGVVGNNAQEKAAPLLNGFAQFFLPIFAWLELFFIEPDETTGILKLADYETGDFQVWRRIADKDAAAGSLLFTICLVHEVRISYGGGVFFAPATMQFGYEVNWVGREDADLFGEPAKVNNDLVALAGIELFENI